MYTSQIKSPYKHYRKLRICQGDIFEDLLISIGSGSDTNHAEFNLEYAVVLAQDCDLQQDFDERKVRPIPTINDKYLDTVLICPAYLLEEFAQGTHIAGRRMNTFSAKEIEKKLKQNDVFKRYHYLSEDLDNGVPELVLDFKHFLTAPRDVLYSRRKESYVATVNEIYREALSQRFTNFLSRIGLPDNSSS